MYETTMNFLLCGKKACGAKLLKEIRRLTLESIYFKCFRPLVINSPN